MSDIHVLQKNDNSEHLLVFHFAVAGGNNDVPVAAGGTVGWQEAVATSLGGSPTSVLLAGDGTKGTVSVAEAASIASGAVLERSYSFPVDSGGTTDAQRAASIRAFYAQMKAQVTAKVAAKLGYFGAILSEA